MEHNLLQEGKEALWSRVTIDHQCQLVAVETMESTSTRGDEFKDPRLVSEYGVVHGKSNGFPVRSTLFSLVLVVTLAGYCVCNTTVPCTHVLFLRQVKG